MEQGATGGDAGGSTTGPVGLAGNATSSLSITRNNLSALTATVYAVAGGGGVGFSTHGGNSGTAAATLNISSNSPLSATAKANPGNAPGGGAGVGNVSGNGGSGFAVVNATQTGTTPGHSSVNVTVESTGANGGSGGVGGNGGLGTAIATANSAGPDNVVVNATASGGFGGSGDLASGGNGGHGVATATGVSTGGANVTVNATGSGGAHGNGGLLGAGTASASATTNGLGIAKAISTGGGSSGSADALAVVSGTQVVLSSRASAGAPVIPSGVVTEAGAAIGQSANSVFHLSTQQSGAFALGEPEADGVLSTAPHIASALSNDPSAIKARGAVTLNIPANADTGIGADAAISFDLDKTKLPANAHLTLGLVSAAPINGGLTGPGYEVMQLSVQRNGNEVLGQGFGKDFRTNASMTSYFGDTGIDLGLLTSSPSDTIEHVTVTIDFTGDVAGNGIQAQFLLGVSTASLNGAWNSSTGASWSDPTKWQNNLLPNGSGAQAVFGNGLSGAATISLDATTTVGGLQLNSANGYTVVSGAGGPFALNFDNGGNAATVTVSNGVHAINAPIVLANGATFTTASSATKLTLGGGFSGTGSVTFAGSGTFVLTGSSSYTGNTTVNPGVTLAVGSSSTGGSLPATRLISNGTTIFAANSGSTLLVRNLGGITVGATGRILLTPAITHANRTVLVTTDLGFAGTTNNWQGLLDLSSNDAIIRNANPADAANQIKQAYHNGVWNGSGGITSSLANQNILHATALGYASATELKLTSYDGVSISGSDLVIHYGLSGDANLDDKVDIRDLALLASHWRNAGDWYGGDFNYDGTVDAKDLGLLARNWDAGVFGAAPGSALDASVLTSLGLPQVEVPEPGAIMSIAMSGLCVLSARRRRRQTCSA